MTMPHLMNCSHSGDGWCLDCVKKLWEENDQARQRLENVRSKWHKEALVFEQLLGNGSRIAKVFRRCIGDAHSVFNPKEKS